MLASTRNFDAICLHLRDNYSNLGNNPLRKEADKLFKYIVEVVSSGKKIKPFLDSSLSEIFNLRVKAIYWLVENNELDFSTAFKEIFPRFEEMKKNSKLEVLADNILFALRCNQRVINDIKETGQVSEESFKRYVSSTDVITYNDFLKTIAFTIPDDEMAQRIVDWANASLYIEFVIVAAALIFEEKVSVSNKSINELSFLVANAAQEYLALSSELGFLESTIKKNHINSEKFSNDYVKKQKALADLGLDHYSNTLTN